MKSHLPITYWSFVQLFRNCVERMVVILSCSVQNVKTIKQLKRMLWMNNITWDLSLKWVSLLDIFVKHSDKGFSLLCSLPHLLVYSWDKQYLGIPSIISSPSYYHGLTLIPAWMCNHMPSKVWDEITYPFLNFNSCTIGSLGKDK